MATISPRGSLWSEPGRIYRMSAQDEEDELDDIEDQDTENLIDDDFDERTRLDRTIDRIGMGSYQWTLLSLCGFGWLADNMWIQAVAIILPRVQQHYAVPDNYIGTVSSSMFAGMMVGALGWGTCSDLMGRSMAFNLTLFFTSLFGLLASFANSFLTLCLMLFFLGSAVGGSMPTDGTLLLEHMPNGKKYLVTALSVFFSFGAVLAAVVALLVVPQHSCSEDTALVCDVETQNKGWKYLLISLGLITLTMFLARMVFFRLHESPRFLVHAGRPQEALESLQMISKFNGSDILLAIEDVDDQRPQLNSYIPTNGSEQLDEASTPFLSRKPSDEPEPVDSVHVNEVELPDQARETVFDSGVAHYSSTGESSTALGAHVFATPTIEFNAPASLTLATSDSNANAPAPVDRPSHVAVDVEPSPRLRPQISHRRTSRRLSRRTSSVYERKICGTLPRWLRRPVWAWWDRVMLVLTPEWLRTTILVWAVWWAISLAYTMFNVFLPKLLETSGSGSDMIPKTLEESLWDVVIFTLGGCPGAIFGAYMVESPLGRRWSLAGSTFVTGFFCIVFIMANSTWAIRASSVGISLSAATMYAILYGWTPEIFGTEIRGTACGIASALSRIGGMIAPVLGGVFLMIDRSVPVYTSVGVFCFAGFCTLLLKENAGNGERKNAAKVFVH
ncbi:major facilitator superfamily domain-containing protein [Rhodocollybia butyracea]|uniref:Major facilitator superfamily domain-containing protein n=1 Tax=Rhodocollybia butyracea TaxID=206335 RepID=A0A9P5PIR2_9AGAR|nr:major facilitator superfamily domain-containing protein [Rhodocollybia butyracea]